MASYKVILSDGTEQVFENIVSVDWNDRTVAAIEGDTMDIAFVYPIAAIKSVTKVQ